VTLLEKKNEYTNCLNLHTYFISLTIVEYIPYNLLIDSRDAK